MQLNLKMIDKSDYGIAALAAVSAWAASVPMGTWLELHPLTKTALQGTITIGLGLGAVVAQHFLRRYLRRNWPDSEGKAKESEP